MVLVVAINLKAGDFGYLRPGMEWEELLQFGVRPMVSILTIGLFPLLRGHFARAGERPFLAGFEVFGAAAALLYVFCARLFTVPIHGFFVETGKRVMSTGMFFYPWLLTAVLLLPQLLGAWLSSRYRVTVHVVRRQFEDHGRLQDESSRILS
jgi:hypothetical protein